MVYDYIPAGGGYLSAQRALQISGGFKHFIIFFMDMKLNIPAMAALYLVLDIQSG